MIPVVKLDVALFARGRELVGRDRVEVVIPIDQRSACVADLRTALTAGFPALARLVAVSRIAVNHEFAGDDAPVRPGDELALIPPVSGG